MRDIQRITDFATEQRIPPLTKPPALSTQPAPDFLGPKDREDARTHLLYVRHRINGKTEPSKSFRAKVGLRKEADIEKINTTFSLEERRDAFDNLLQGREPVGIAQAVIDFHPQPKFDINVRHEPPAKGFRKGHTAAGDNIIASRWLQIATELNQEDWVRLLASRKPAQSNLDESLRIAVRQSSIPMTTELLRYGANGNTCHREFHTRATNGDMVWTALLLSSRFHVIDQTKRDKALFTAVENGNLDMAHLLLLFGADANHSSGLPIVSAIRNSDFRMLTLLISTSSRLMQESLQRAIDCACTSIDPTTPTRDDTIDILLSAGAETPSHILADLMNTAVYGNDTALVSILVKHRQISVASATEAMSKLPNNLSEDEALRMSRLLFAAGAEAKTLGALLYWAVEKDYDQMIALLVHYGVSLDFHNAIAVQFALRQQDNELLNLLLNGNKIISGNSISTNTILAIALPQALDINSKGKRHEAVRFLLRKGVEGPYLDQALLDVVTTPAICDSDLVQMLLAGGASVNLYKDNKNCVLNAANDGNMAILDLLSAPKWGALPRILSEAVLRVYQSRTKLVRSDFINTLTLLLQRGAECNGAFVARTLIIAIQAANDGNYAAIVELLLRHGANVNYQDGEPIKEALKLVHDRVLAAICMTKSIDQNSFAHALPPAIQASRVNQSKLSILLHSCRSFQTNISDALIAEVGGGHSGGQDEIVNLLLKNGADVNYEKGAVLAKAIGLQPLSKSMDYSCLLLAKGPRKTALHTAFDSARKLQCPLDHRHDLFKSVLEAGYEGSSIHLALAENIIASKDDLTIPRLLLHRGASINYDRGSVLALATESGNIQLVDMLLDHKPDKLTVNRAFKATCHAHVSDSCKTELFKCLLATKKVSKDCVTYALTHAITHGSMDVILLGLLARHGPSVESETLLTLISRQDVATTRFLMKFQIPRKETRSLAFKSCLDLERAIRLAFAELIVVTGLEIGVWKAALHRSIQDQDTNLLSLLLNHGSDKRLEIDEALVLATDTMNSVIVQILLCHGPSSGAIDRTFDKMLSSSRMRSTTDSIAVATSLLEHGISQSLKDRALVQSLESYPHDQSDFLQVLIQHGADVNTKSYICFNLAGRFDDLEMFSLLLESTANFDLVIKSLISHFPQNKYERLLELVFVTLMCPRYQGERSDVEVIFEAMRRYNQGDGLIRLLLDHDYPVGQTLRSGDGNTLNTEAVTPVIWALGQPRPWISDDVILALLKEEERARPSFATEESEITAISLAARFGRHAILERLIELNVNVSAMDSSRKSPLFYAVANADSMSVYLLLEKGAQCNDGSLHEAARLCQRGIVALLLEADHDPDYSCDIHDGRTALGELCSRAVLQNGEQISAAYETMKLLINAPTNLSFGAKGKTVMHLALENHQPFEVTRVLLRFPEIYRNIPTDSEMFIYKDSQGRFMSPDVYAMRYCKCGDHSQSLLIDLLQKKGCKKKWFTKQGEQLVDCKGLPAALKEAMDQQDIADQDERRATQRRLESAKVDLDIKQQHHKANMIQSKEQADLDLYNTQRVNDQQIAHDNILSTQRRNNMNAERADERWHIQESKRLEYNAAKEKSQLEYSSQQQLKQLEFLSQKEGNQQRYAALEREAGLEKKLLESKEAAENRNQIRTMERFSRQDASIKLAAQEQRALIAATKEARVSTQAAQLAIPWDQPD